MSDLQQLELEVEQLSREDFAKFREWFVELDWKLWDSKIENDLKEGKLGQIISEAKSELKMGKAQEL
jgi:hypothetical protein